MNDYAKQVVTGVYKAFEGTKYSIEVASVNFDAGQELANAESLIAKGAVGIISLGVTIESSAAAAQKAFEAGIPFGNAVWPGPSDADKYFTAVASLGSEQGGKLMGEYLTTALPDGGKICVVQAVTGQGFSELIDKGLDAAIAGTKLEVVVREQGFFDRTKAIGVVDSAFQAHPDLAAIVTYAASMSDGVAQWLKDNPKPNVIHLGDDADDEEITWLKTPYLTAIRYYSGAQTGFIAANGVLAKLQGGTPWFMTEIDQVMATPDTIASVIAATPYIYEEYRSKVDNL